jgi:hypothetical protein
MPDMPEWLPTFLFIACAVLFLLIPIRVLWKIWRERSDDGEAIQQLADRWKSLFPDISVRRMPFTPATLYFHYEERPLHALFPKPKVLLLELDVDKLPHSPVVIRSGSAGRFPFVFEGWRLQRRSRTEAESILFYGNPSLAALYREMETHGEGPHINLPESVTILSQLPGVSAFELRGSKAGGFRLRLTLKTDDLLYRPEHFESAVLHFTRLYEGLVLE